MAKQPIIEDKAKNFDMVFPMLGVEEARAYQKQRAETSPDALNVVGFDPGEDRARGGSRSGLSKYITGQPNGTNLIQDLSVVVGSGYAAPGTGGVGGYFLYLDYVWTTNGFTLASRLLLEPTGNLTRDSSLVYNTAITGTAPGSLIDFTTAGSGFQLRITVSDGSTAIEINGQTTVTVPLEIISGSPNYLGTSQTAYNLTTTYTSDPGAKTYTVTAKLLDGDGSEIAVTNSGGSATGGNINETFAASTAAGTGPDGRAMGTLGGTYTNGTYVSGSGAYKYDFMAFVTFRFDDGNSAVLAENIALSAPQQYSASVIFATNAVTSFYSFGSQISNYVPDSYPGSTVKADLVVGSSFYLGFPGSQCYVGGYTPGYAIGGSVAAQTYLSVQAEIFTRTL